MRRFQEYRETVNRSVFNKLHKEVLERKGLIRCSICPYHGSENDTNSWYGQIASVHHQKVPFKHRIKYPNWKLISKNPKQWMKKPLKKEIMKSIYYDDYFEFKW